MPNRQGLGWNVADVLGGLGDAISVGAGGQSNYLNQVARDRYATGIEEFNTNPSQGLQTMAQAVGPEAANTWYNNWVRAQNDAQQNAAQAERYGYQNKKDQESVDAITRARYLGMLRTASPDNYDTIRRQADQYAATRNWKPDFEVPGQYKEGWAVAQTEAELDPKDYATTQESKRYHDITNANADATRFTQTKLGEARVQATLQGQADARRRDDLNLPIKKQNADTRTQNANRPRYHSPKAIPDGARVQTSPSTGKKRYSTDGGQTWTIID